MEKRFYLLSLGCAKNTVDSDSMAQLLFREGYRAVENAADADVLIVNTCGFIAPAREESITALQDLAAQKREGQILIAAGCLTQRYGEAVSAQVPEVDGILGTRRWMDIPKVIRALREEHVPAPLYHLPETPTVGTDEKDTLRASLFGGSAYLKIADGCRRPCAFCAIPQIKGTLVSRPMEKILDDARRLQDMGIQELILIAQDTTDYGHDLGEKDGLPRLLEAISAAAPNIPWIRVMYAFPGYVTDALIEIMASNPQILPYLDMPLQHAHPATLRRMRRPANLPWVRETIAKIRERIPNLAIRTTFIVGYPEESEEEFQTLLDFLEEMRFDRVGAFQFSYEEGTASAAFGDTVPAEEKESRYERLMTLQQDISLEINRSYVGKTLEVLIEGVSEEVSIGRSYRDAPEIDGLIFVYGKANVGDIVPVKITDAMPYDLAGILQS